MEEGRQIYQFSTRIIGFTQRWLIDRMVELDKSRHLLLLLSLVKLICGVLAAFSFNLTKHIRWAVIQVIGFVYCVRDRRRVCFLLLFFLPLSARWAAVFGLNRRGLLKANTKYLSCWSSETKSGKWTLEPKIRGSLFAPFFSSSWRWRTFLNIRSWWATKGWNLGKINAWIHLIPYFYVAVFGKILRSNNMLISNM